MDDKKACKDVTDEGSCSGACSWDGGECKYDPKKCPIPGESPIVVSGASDECKASLAQYMDGRFVGADGGERGRICPPNGTSIAVPDEETCQRICSSEQECKYYTFFPPKSGGMGACSTHKEEECRAMISSNYTREQAASNEKVYDFSVDEAIVASSAEQCWAKDIKSDTVASMLITPEFRGDDFIEDSSRCVLLGEHETCAKVKTVANTDECPLSDLPCYAGYEDGCYHVDKETGECPVIPVPRDHRIEILKSVEDELIECEMAHSRTECNLIDTAIVEQYSIVDPIEGIPIETLYISDENGVEIEEKQEITDAINQVDLERAMTKRYGNQVVDFANNVKVLAGDAKRSIKCTVPLDSNTYLMMLDSAENIDVSRGLVEHMVVADGKRNVKNKTSGERCISDMDCAPTTTDAIICELFDNEEECNANSPCKFENGVCQPQHGKCDLTGEYSCFGRCLADRADPYKSRRENCPIDDEIYEKSCERMLERVADALRPEREARGYKRYKRTRPKKREDGMSCFRNADCANGVCNNGLCGPKDGKKQLGEACSTGQCDGSTCGRSGPCEGRCQKDGSCPGGLVPLQSADFAGLLDLDMFGCTGRTNSAAEAAALCERSILLDPEIQGVTKCNAFLRYEDRHPGNLSGKTCFYNHITDEVDEKKHLEAWEILRNDQKPGQGASGDLYIRNVTQPLPEGGSKRNARPKTFGTLTPVEESPGCDAEKNILDTIMAELEEDENLEKNEADVDIDDVLAQQVSPPKSSGHTDPCNENGDCCPSMDYKRDGNICYGREGNVAGTRCRLGDIQIPNSEKGRFDLLLSIVDGESGCTVDKANEKLTVLVNSHLHTAFSELPSFSNEEMLREQGGFMRTSDNQFDVLSYRPGFDKLDKSVQTFLIEKVISTVVPRCPTAEDRIRLARENRKAKKPKDKGPSTTMLGAMIIVGILLAVASAKKKIPSKALVAYAGMCAVGIMATSM